ncbi:MAG TPA: biotin transporter BioY [Gaiellaceae bacterium]|jgi:biotin transport system substrate-specific component
MTAQTPAATLRVALLPKSGLLTDALLVVGGAGLVAACAQVSFHLGFTPVPITLQTFAVVVVGASLGSIRGCASLLLYLAVGIAGAPVYSQHKHGWSVVSGSTGGYLVGFVVAASLIGFLAERGWDRRVSSSVSAMLTGNVAIYLFGLLWLHHWLGANGFGNSWNTTLTDGLYAFVPGDMIKLYLAAAALPGAWRLVGAAKRRTGR